MKFNFKFLFLLLMGLSLGGCVKLIEKDCYQGTVRIDGQGQQLWFKFNAHFGEDYSVLRMGDWLGLVELEVREQQGILYLWKQGKLIDQGTVRAVTKRQMGLELPWCNLKDYFSGKITKIVGLRGEIIQKNGRVKQVKLENNTGRVIFYLN